MELPAVAQLYTELGILGLLAVVVVMLMWRAFGHKHEDDLWKNSKIDKKDDLLENDKQDVSQQLKTLTELLVKQNQEYHRTDNERLSQMQEMNREMMQQIIEGVTSHVPSHDENNKLTELNYDLDEILKDIILETNADRVSLIQYHNGGKGINKQAFLKMSMTNEKFQLGVKPLMTEFKDQFRSVLGYFVNEVNTNGHCYINNFEEMLEKDIGIYEFMKNRGIQSKYGYGIRDKQGMTIAFVCAEFEHKEDANETKINDSFKEHYREIERLLNS